MFGIEGLHQVVDRAALVAGEHVRGVAVDRRDEDDGDVRGARVTFHQRRGLEAVHARHLHVQQHERELLGEQAAEGFRARHRRHRADAEWRQCSLECDEVRRAVVHEQHGSGSAVRFARAAVGIPGQTGVNHGESAGKLRRVPDETSPVDGVIPSAVSEAAGASGSRASAARCRAATSSCPVSRRARWAWSTGASGCSWGAPLR